MVKFDMKAQKSIQTITMAIFVQACFYGIFSSSLAPSYHLYFKSLSTYYFINHVYNFTHRSMLTPEKRMNHLSRVSLGVTSLNFFINYCDNVIV